MEIRFAQSKDMEQLVRLDRHISKEELKNSIRLSRVYVLEEGGEVLGWLRYNLFWDNTPFMNMLYLLEESRGKGFGKSLVTYWENEMKGLGYETVMTSTVSCEQAQHFYHRLGYAAVGGFALGDDPYEVILSKKL